MPSAPALTPQEMVEIGEEFSVLRPDTCLIKRNTRTEDAAGSPVDALETLASVECRVDESPGAVLRVAGPVYAAHSTAVIALPLQAPCGDRYVIELARTGEQFLVQGVMDQGSFRFELIALAARRQ